MKKLALSNPDVESLQPMDPLRLISWNIRAGGGERAGNIAAQLRRWRADVVALCEFRGTEPSRTLAATLANSGLGHQQHTVNEAVASENRLLIASRWPIERLHYAGAPDESGRWLAVRVTAPRPFALIGMHVPNRASGHKWPFHDAVLRVVQDWGDTPAVLVGDTNTGRIGIDAAPAATGFNDREDRWMRALEHAAWHDGFRRRHGTRRSWTWYSPNAGNGYRLDQSFLNAALIERLIDVRHTWGRRRGEVRRDALSDHAALIVDLAH